MPTPNPLYKCNNLDGECSNAVNKVYFRLRQGEELKCPVCGKKDIELVKDDGNDRRPIPWKKIITGAAIVLLLVLIGYKFLYKDKDRLTGSSGVDRERSRPYLVLAGSNTIGESLAPALVQGWLESIQAKGVHPIFKLADGKEVPDEKEIEAVLPNGEKIIVEIRAHGSKTGFHDLLNDSADIGMASEPVNDSIYQLFLRKNPNENIRSFSNENIIGHDGIAVIVNAGNPISELSIDQVRQMFMDGGHITDWSSIPNSGKTGPIDLYRRDDKSGTTAMFKTMALGGGNNSFAASAQKIEKSTELVDKVSSDQNGIGFVSYTFTKDRGGIKVLALKAGEGIQALIPNPVTIKNENYKLSRRLYLYCLNSDTNSHVKPFLQFVSHTEEGQKLVDRSGFIDLVPNVDNSKMPDIVPDGYTDLIRNAQKQSIIFRFNSGSTVLDNLAEGDIKRLFDLYYLPENRNKKVILIGFADNVGSAEANLKISQDRAGIVKNRLAQMYIPIQAVKGFGAALPVHNNSDEHERSLNRRVEVWLTN